MPLQYHEYLAALHAALDECRQQPGPEMSRVEACFKCSLDHWAVIQKLLRHNGFRNPAEEIHFFREIKHRFTAPIEYYTHRYHALLFMPAEDDLELMRFWEWELRKIDRFYEINDDFHRYIREGATDKDPEYFLRRTCRLPPHSPIQVLNLDPELSTPWDHLLTIMGAYEMYRDYIRSEMRKLGGYFF